MIQFELFVSDIIENLPISKLISEMANKLALQSQRLTMASLTSPTFGCALSLLDIRTIYIGDFLSEPRKEIRID